jgi:hypothetical protein
MKLIKPPYPDTTNTGLYYCTQAAHRKTAINLAIAALQELPAFYEMDQAMREWTIGAVVQGALVREYHKWETDTKDYFDAMHVRNGNAAPNWQVRASHVKKIKMQLDFFSATHPISIEAIEETRKHVNNMKHNDGYLANRQDYEDLTCAVDQFWQGLDAQESFTPPDRKL